VSNIAFGFRGNDAVRRGFHSAFLHYACKVCVHVVFIYLFILHCGLPQSTAPAGDSALGGVVLQRCVHWYTTPTRSDVH
jgi:hypothetical protein